MLQRAQVWAWVLSLGGLMLTGSAHAQNVAPVITGSPATTAATGQEYSFTPSASDADGDTLSFGVGGLPRWASFDKRTGRLYGRPGSRYIGTSRAISIAVSDGRKTSNLPSFTITVRAGGSPWISGTPATSATLGAAYSFKPTAGDPDGEQVTFLISNKPSWATFSRSSGQLAGTPPAGSAGTYSNIRISATDGSTATSLPMFAIVVAATSPAQVTNAPPRIAGASPITATAGELYSFQPAATDPENAKLTYSILNLPTWATFDTLSGRLAGTPSTAQVGTSAGVTIRVSDGVNTASLPSFAITVNQPAAAGTATLAWLPPTQNVDGTALQNLAGFRIRYGSASDRLDQLVTIPSPVITTATIESLPPGTWYFAVHAYTSANVESGLSNIVRKSIF